MKKLIPLLILPIFALAQFNFVPINADYASFASTDTSSFVQIYVSIYQGNLSYKMNEDSVYAASFSTQLSVSQNDSLIHSSRHNYQNTAPDTAKILKYNQFVDIYSIDIPLGTFDVSAEIIDHNSGLRGESNFSLNTVRPQENFYFSDVELCTKIEKANGQTMFNKNGLQVLPNPSGVYDVLNPLFYYYIELNKLSHSAASENTYQFRYFFTNSNGDTLRKKPWVTKKIAAPSQVELGGMNVIALPAGDYVFHAHGIDMVSGTESQVEKAFRVYKPTKKVVNKERSSDEIDEHYIGLSKEQLKEEFKQAIYVSVKQEKKVFESLGELESMQKFLTQFWLRQDKERNLPFGSFRRLYLKRVNIANEKYGSMSTAGWKTDMGRVFIMYGEPDEYERNPNSIDLLPHVIWTYHNLEGGAKFIFADEEGFGRYRLIHSTYRRELQNPNWQSIISKNSRMGSGSSQF